MRHRSTIRFPGPLVLALCVATWPAHPLGAQGPPRHGVWASVAGGPVWATWHVTFHPSTEDLGRDAGLLALTGSGMVVGLGGTPSARVRVGGEVALARCPLGRGDGGSLSRTSLAAVVQYYPNPDANFFLTASAGTATVSWDRPDFEGLGASLGVGHDWPLVGGVHLTGGLEAHFGVYGRAAGGLLGTLLGLTWSGAP